MDYPGRVIKQGEQNAALLRALKRQLNEALRRDNPMSEIAGC